jgi:AcrR family transcriptional regulator
MAERKRDGSRPGRTTGSPNNREAILASARREFTENGFEGTTIRRIAVGAGVDVALLYHYFASKDELLLESLRAAETSGLSDVLDGDRDGIGERLLRRALATYDDGSDTLVGLIRAASTHEEAARVLRESLMQGYLIQLVKSLHRPQPGLRATLIASVLIGLTTSRSIIGAEELTGATTESLISWYAPTIQQYLVGALLGD